MIHCQCVSAAATDFGPTIHNDFPAVFPTPALRGVDLRIECFAYGRWVVSPCVKNTQINQTNKNLLGHLLTFVIVLSWVLFASFLSFELGSVYLFSVSYRFPFPFIIRKFPPEVGEILRVQFLSCI